MVRDPVALRGPGELAGWIEGVVGSPAAEGLWEPSRIAGVRLSLKLTVNQKTG